MQKTKGNLAFAEKYKLVQWLEQNLTSLGGRTYESIAQEATQALGYYISENVLEGINRDEELVAVKWKTSRAMPDEPISNEQLMDEFNKLKQEVVGLRNKLDDLLSVKKPHPFSVYPQPRFFRDDTQLPYNLTSVEHCTPQLFGGDEPAKA